MLMFVIGGSMRTLDGTIRILVQTEKVVVLVLWVVRDPVS